MGSKNIFKYVQKVAMILIALHYSYLLGGVDTVIWVGLFLILGVSIFTVKKKIVDNYENNILPDELNEIERLKRNRK